MRRSRVKKKTSAWARWRGKCAKWMCNSGTFLRRYFCGQRSKDIWKASGSNGCDFESRKISGTGAATLERASNRCWPRWKAGQTAD